MVKNGPAKILAIDDDPTAQLLLEEILELEGYEVQIAPDPAAAWKWLRSEEIDFDVVLLDRMMPGTDGLTILQEMKSDPELQQIPVILHTAKTDPEEIAEGIEAGAYYYLTKPLDWDMVHLVIRAAVRDHRRHQAARETIRQGRGMLAALRSAEFELRTLVQAEDLATILSYACPDPEKTVVGLSELLVNAVEHGNLGIDYEEKSRLLEEGSWDEEIARRLELEENRDKIVEVVFERTESELRFTIRDQGRGFDWQRYLEISPDRVFDAHGRGIAMANALSFSHIEYRPPGNEVLAVIDLDESTETAMGEREAS